MPYVLLTVELPDVVCVRLNPVVPEGKAREVVFKLAPKVWLLIVAFAPDTKPPRLLTPCVDTLVPKNELGAREETREGAADRERGVEDKAVDKAVDKVGF